MSAEINEFDTQYKAILKNIIDNGVWQNNRTNVKTKWFPGAIVTADLQRGFPALTLRKLRHEGATAEMQGFLRGYSSSDAFDALGCKFWHANANLPTKGSSTSPWLSSPHRKGENDLGEIYGVLWRNWKTELGFIDQIQQVIDDIRNNPESRRMVVTGWNPESVMKVKGALPPCHVLWNVMVDTHNKVMHLSWYQRSVDMVLGLPSNMIEYAFLLSLIARLSGYTAGRVIGHLDNVHIYEDHIDAARTMINRTPKAPATLVFNSEVPHGNVEEKIVHAEWLENISNKDFCLVNYVHHEPISGLTMAV